MGIIDEKRHVMWFQVVEIFFAAEIPTATFIEIVSQRRLTVRAMTQL